MQIAIDISPLQTGHSIRGTGFYVTHLRDALLEYFPKNIYFFLSGKEKIPSSVDIIHYPYFDPFFLTLPLLKRKKTVVTIHDVTPLVFPQLFPIGKKGIVKWQIQKLLAKHMDAIITDSESSKTDIMRLLHISKEKIHVVYLAAAATFGPQEKQKSLPIVEKYNLPKEFVLYVGDATPNKNLPRLIDAMSALHIPLVMVGKTLGEERHSKNPWDKDILYVQAKAKENKNIILLGFVSHEDLIGLYNSAKVFVMPSLYEGFGLPVLEAMACGCPVVTTKVGSLPEIAGDAAVYVDAYDAEAIGKGVLDVMKNKNAQKELSAKGLIQAKKFSWEKTAKQTLDVYEKVLAEK